MRKSLLSSITAVVLSGHTVMAGSYSTPTYVETPIVAPPITITDWSGPYVGGSVNFDLASEYTLLDVGLPVDTFLLSPNTSFGAFVGYNIQHQAFVYGGELAINSGGMTAEATDASFGPVIDVKTRAGFVLGNALIYGVVGGSFTTLSVPPTEEFPSSGLTYGVGLDYLINEHLFVGAEYLVRDLTGGSNEASDSSISATLQSAQLRVGWKF